MPEDEDRVAGAPDTEIWVPEPPAELTADDVIWTAKNPSLKNTILLVRTISAVLARAALRFDDIFPDGDMTEDGVVELLALLDENLVRATFAIICDTTAEEIDRTFTPIRAIRVIMQFLGIVDLPAILGEVRKATKRKTETPSLSATAG